MQIKGVLNIKNLKYLHLKPFFFRIFYLPIQIQIVIVYHFTKLTTFNNLLHFKKQAPKLIKISFYKVPGTFPTIVVLGPKVESNIV